MNQNTKNPTQFCWKVSIDIVFFGQNVSKDEDKCEVSKR